MGRTKDLVLELHELEDEVIYREIEEMEAAWDEEMELLFDRENALELVEFLDSHESWR